MNVKFYVLGSLCLLFILFSCKEQTQPKESALESKEVDQENEIRISNLDHDSIIGILQGKWKEIEYSFRLADFNNSTVKFTDEGMVDEPTYQEFKISQECPFEVNNIKNAGSNDIFLAMVQAGTCEIVKASSEALILSGFSINSNSDYSIIYLKEE